MAQAMCGICSGWKNNVTVGLHDQRAGLIVETEFARTRYDHYQFGITRATGAIAESGSLILDDDLTSDRLAALSP